MSFGYDRQVAKFALAGISMVILAHQTTALVDASGGCEPFCSEAPAALDTILGDRGIRVAGGGGCLEKLANTGGGTAQIEERQQEGFGLLIFSKHVSSGWKKIFF